MNSRILIESDMNAFHDYLIREEKSTATVEKYLRDVRAFFVFAEQESVSKEMVLDYKRALIEKNMLYVL